MGFNEIFYILVFTKSSQLGVCFKHIARLNLDKKCFMCSIATYDWLVSVLDGVTLNWYQKLVL